MSLRNSVKFQKALALAASASNEFEAEAAELAARRLMESCGIDPTDIPTKSLYDQGNFANSTLLKKLRDEWREQHPVIETPAADRPKRRDMPALGFSIDGFRKANNLRRQDKRKQKAHRYRGIPRETRAEQLRQLINDGLGRGDICRLHGFTTSEISGIIRDYAGQPSSTKRRTPSWRSRYNGHHLCYDLVSAVEAECDKPDSMEHLAEPPDLGAVIEK